MTKTQKIMFWVFSGLFLLPEILWSPIGNFIYEFVDDSANVKPFRDNFLMGFDNYNLYSSVLFVQFVSILSFFIYLIYLHKKISNKIVLWLGLIVSFLLSVIAFFCFGLSISLRNIGF